MLILTDDMPFDELENMPKTLAWLATGGVRSTRPFVPNSLSPASRPIFLEFAPYAPHAPLRARTTLRERAAHLHRRGVAARLLPELHLAQRRRARRERHACVGAGPRPRAPARSTSLRCR